MTSRYSKRYPRSEQSPGIISSGIYSLTVNEGNAAILDIRSFDYELLEDFIHFVDSAFIVLQNLDNPDLIIVIRDNGRRATDVSDEVF